MSDKPKAPIPRFTVVTLGVGDMRTSIAFYEALGFARKFRATGEAVAFFDTGATVLGLFPWNELAQDVTLPDNPRPKTFRGITLVSSGLPFNATLDNNSSLNSDQTTRPNQIADATQGAQR